MLLSIDILELLWGLEERMYDFELLKATMRSPSYFRVFEVKSSEWFMGSKWSIYLVGKYCISTFNALAKLSGVLKSERYSYAGLKDAYSISYQYVSFINPRVSPSYINLGDVRAWLIGRGSIIRPGSHTGNIFRITLEVDDPDKVAYNLSRVKLIPSFYGPQRFGVERPSTHMYGLALARMEPGLLAREFKYRYPGEDIDTLSIEEKLLQEARTEINPWILVDESPRIYTEALQAYLYNRALSRALRSRKIDQIRESIVTIRYCNETISIPAVRLPSRELVEKETQWAKIVKSICLEEGINIKQLKTLEPSLRPIYYPIKLRSTTIKDNTITFTICLPPSAYATILLREIVELETVNKCKPNK